MLPRHKVSKVFDCLVSVRLRRFMECRGVILTTQFGYKKGLGTFDAKTDVIKSS